MIYVIMMIFLYHGNQINQKNHSFDFFFVSLHQNQKY